MQATTVNFTPCTPLNPGFGQWQSMGDLTSLCRISPQDSREREMYLDALSVLFERVCKHGTGVCTMDLTHFLYSPIKLSDNTPSGAECAKQLLSGIVDRSYTLPRDEITFIQRNTETLYEHFRPIAEKTPITFVSLGCGPSTSVEQKDIPLIRAVGANRYVCIDINPDFAQIGSKIVADTVHGIESLPFNGDFTKSFSLKNYTKDSLVVMSMLGDTIGQFPVLEKTIKGKNLNGVTLSHLMGTLGKATDFKAILLATTDMETRPATIEAKYQGECMIAMMKTLWKTAKEVTGDTRFNPSVFTYTAKFDPALSAIQFAHTADEATSITIRGKKYNIAGGTRFIIGHSQKMKPETAIPTCEKAGWEKIPLQPEINNTVRMLALRGKNCTL